jgi:diguanylate cyclase (GGDEF)-like protein
MNAVLALFGSIIRLPRPILIVILFSAASVAVYFDILTDKRFSLGLMLAPVVALATWIFGVKGGVGSTLIASFLPTWMGWMLNAPAAGTDYGAALVRFLVFGGLAAVVVVLKQRLLAQSRLAGSDALTGLANRQQLFARGESELHEARCKGATFSALFIDCDHFKAINDVWGHSTGDELLREVAESIRQVAGEECLAARLGGDEFVVLRRGVDASAVQLCARQLQSVFAMRMAQRDCPLTLSIGAVLFDRLPCSLDDVIAMADDLMYSVKRHGRNSVEFRQVAAAAGSEAAG